MKNRFIIAMALLFGFAISSSYAQSKMKIGDNAGIMVSNALLEIESTTGGFLPPRMTMDDRNAMVSPVAGLLIWCRDCGTNGEIEIFNGTTWTHISDAASGTLSLNSGDAITDGTRRTAVVAITGAAGKTWMDRNLGASRAATSSTDYQAYGGLYQWGRGNDGHASIIWNSSTAGSPVNGTTQEQFRTDTPNNDLFTIYFDDWRFNQNDALWQGVTGVNNPCPSGYRIPSNSEVEAEFTASSITDHATAYSSVLKMVSAGFRKQFDGELSDYGRSGYYWSATVNNAEALSIRIYDGGTGTYSNYRNFGYSVRCIKD